MWLIDYLDSLFSGKPDAAKLIAILVSSIVAVLIVLLNKWITDRREAKHFRGQKLEELFVIVCSASVVLGKLIRFFAHYYETKEEADRLESAQKKEPLSTRDSDKLKLRITELKEQVKDINEHVADFNTQLELIEVFVNLYFPSMKTVTDKWNKVITAKVNLECYDSTNWDEQSSSVGDLEDFVKELKRSLTSVSQNKRKWVQPNGIL